MPDAVNARINTVASGVRVILVNVAAIKLIREQTGLGLKEAKELVDDYIAVGPEISSDILSCL